MYATKPYRDAVKMQTVLMRDIENPATKPIERAQLARAWDALEERKRILKMKPLPKPIDVSANQGKQTRKPAANNFIEGISLTTTTPTPTTGEGGNEAGAIYNKTPTTENAPGNVLPMSEVTKVTQEQEGKTVTEKPSSIIRRLPGVAAK